MTNRMLSITLLLGWCAAMLAVRIWRSGTVSYVFLAWNLFLAVIPLYAATMLERARSNAGQAAWLAVWLGFLPNAPYIVTDFMHLRPRPFIPLWYDVALLTSFALTGLFLTYVSVADVQRFVAHRFGEARSWAVAASAMLLSGTGIYLGRFERWNTWDLLSNPLAIVASIRGRVVSVTLVYGFGLLVGYLAFRALASEQTQSSAAHPRR